MGLEAATYVADLISTNPVSTDLESQGDDHLRLIKLALKNTFKNGSRGEYFQRAVSVSANQVLVAADDKKVYAVSTAGAARTVTLPTLTAADDGWMVGIVKSTTDLNDVTVSPAAGTISGLDSITLHAGYQAAVLLWTGSVWVLNGIDKWPPLRLFALTADTALTNLYFGSLITVTPVAAPVTLTLPTAVGNEGLSLFVERRGATHSVILDGNGAETINGATTYTITQDRGVVLIISDGVGWRVLMTFSGGTSTPAFLDVAQTFTAIQTFSKAILYTEQVLTDAVTISWPMDLGVNAKVTLGGNRNMANPTGENPGQFGQLRVLQDVTGGRTITWGTAYQFTGGDDGRPDPTASSTTLFRYWVRAGDDVLMERVYMSSSDAIGFFKEYNLGGANNNSTQTQAHGLGRRPALVKAFLKCTAANNGYSINDYMELAQLIGSGIGAIVWMNTTNVGVTISTDLFMVSRTTFATLSITFADWDLIVRVYE